MMPVGKFIVLDGIDGAGKTTQAHQLARTLRLRRNVDVVETREPGGTPANEAMRRVFLDYDWDPFEELCLLMAMRRRHVREVIHPALNAGRWVVCDRFSVTTLAYQGWGHCLPISLVLELNGYAVDCCLPDLTLILDLSVEEGRTRLEYRCRDRLENLGPKFYQRVRVGLSQAYKHFDNVLMVNASECQDVVEEQIWRMVEGRFML